MSVEQYCFNPQRPNQTGGQSNLAYDKAKKHGLKKNPLDGRRGPLMDNSVSRADPGRWKPGDYQLIGSSRGYIALNQ